LLIVDEGKGHVNGLKTPKNINFFKSVFETQKQIVFYEIQLKKNVKTASQKLRFKLIF